MLKKFILSKVWVFFICCEEKEQTVKLPTMDGAPKVEFKADKAVLQKGFIGGAVASILMLIAGWIGSLLFASMLSEMFSKFAKELEMLPSFYSSATSTMLSYHLLGFTANDDSGLIFSLSWYTPFTLLLIIPFIIFAGTGIWLGNSMLRKRLKIKSLWQQQLVLFMESFYSL